MAHIHEKIDFVADVFIVNGDAVLLRKHEKYGLWLAPGGHIELDEDPPTAAIREAKEEVGLDVTLAGALAPDFADGEHELLVPRFLNRHIVSPTHEHISFMYFGTSETRDFFQEDGDEKSDAIKWFTVDELDDPAYGVPGRIKHYARAALKELGATK